VVFPPSICFLILLVDRIPLPPQTGHADPASGFRVSLLCGACTGRAIPPIWLSHSASLSSYEGLVLDVSINQVRSVLSPLASRQGSLAPGSFQPFVATISPSDSHCRQLQRYFFRSRFAALPIARVGLPSSCLFFRYALPGFTPESPTAGSFLFESPQSLSRPRSRVAESARLAKGRV
jgi:hypothetical protein